MDFPLEQVCRVLGFQGDPAALGGAVTVGLCGHWEHDGPCRWPHHTSSEPCDEVAGGRAVTVRFAAPADEESLVRNTIRAALALGELAGPDGGVSTWTLAG